MISLNVAELQSDGNGHLSKGVKAQKVENGGPGTTQGSVGAHQRNGGGSAKIKAENTITISMGDTHQEPSKLSVLMNGDDKTRETSNCGQLSNGNNPTFVNGGCSQDCRPDTSVSRPITSMN